MDEAYIGGLESNRQQSERKRTGPKEKAIVAGLFDESTSRVKAQVIEYASRNILVPFVMQATSPETVVYTDEHRAYARLREWREHRTVTHSRGEYVRAGATTNGIESFWSMFKRGFHGTYHHMSHAHLPRYVNEFVGRHNARPLDTEQQMVDTATGMVGKRLRYTDLIA